MNNIWRFDQDTTNSLAIYLNNEPVACIISDSDIEQKQTDIAQFIVDACNEKEAKS